MEIRRFGRKGIFFTVISILLAGLVISSFIVYSNYKYSDQMDIIKVRVGSMDDFIYSIENDLERALYISSFRSLIALNDYITNTNKSGGRLLDNTSESFYQMLQNGTMYDNPDMEILMVDQTIYDWIQKIEDIGAQIGLKTNITLNSIDIWHTGPWKVGISGNFTVIVDDAKGLAHWDIVMISDTEIEITDFRDPLYANRTYGEYRKIVASEITQWDASNLEILLASGEYVAKASSPTFLMRMEGRFKGDPNGILTLIDEDHIQGGIENRSSVDFVYWSMKNNNSQKIYNITDSGYPGFRLDPPHVAFFNVSGYN